MGFLIPAAALVVDRCTKYLAQKDKLPDTVCDGQLAFQHVENSGFAGCMCQDSPEKVKVTHAVAAALLAAAFTAVPSGSRAESTGRWLMLLGAGSNLYDRWEHGSVTDMIRFPQAPGKLNTLVWNVADFMVLSGTALCMLHRRRR